MVGLEVDGGGMAAYKKRVTSTEEEDGKRRLLKIREASELLNVHSNTLRRWSDLGIVQSYRIGPRGDRRFKLEDIALLVAERSERKREKASR